MMTIVDSLLNDQAILTELARLRQNRPLFPIRLEILPEVDSTNRHALSQPEERGIYVCLAEHQTAGRGRLGRQWVSPRGGGLYLSLKQTYQVNHYPITGLSIAIAVDIVKVLRHLGATAVGIKWPNDIWWQQRKLGGILLESRSSGGQIRDIVIGIGLNVTMPITAMKVIEQAWVDLTTIGIKVSRNELAALLITEGVRILAEYPQTGLTPWMADWQRFDLLKGQWVTLLTSTDRIGGIAQGIDESGALWLQTSTGLQRYEYGEVSVR
jgi:BirA family biotin operon repressor/biotin-[acetyl-CoA-carboxylase] ligase